MRARQAECFFRQSSDKAIVMRVTNVCSSGNGVGGKKGYKYPLMFEVINNVVLDMDKKSV